MKGNTVDPLTTDELVNMTGGNAIIKIGQHTARIMNASPGQMIDINCIAYCGGYKWGLKKVYGKSYDYLAYRIKEAAV